MQTSNHKGIVEGSSVNDFQPDDSVQVDISTPVNAELTVADNLDESRPTVVNIAERVPVAVQQAMAAGDYVDTRPAPVSLAIQQTVRSCYTYLWHKHRYGRGKALITDLEKHVQWDNEDRYGALRKAWGISTLSEVLRDYDNQFVLSDMPPRPGSSAGSAEPAPHLQPSVSLARYFEDSREMKAEMEKITGIRELA